MGEGDGAMFTKWWCCTQYLRLECGGFPSLEPLTKPQTDLVRHDLKDKLKDNHLYRKRNDPNKTPLKTIFANGVEAYVVGSFPSSRVRQDKFKNQDVR